MCQGFCLLIFALLLTNFRPAAYKFHCMSEVDPNEHFQRWQKREIPREIPLENFECFGSFDPLSDMELWIQTKHINRTAVFAQQLSYSTWYFKWASPNGHKQCDKMVGSRQPCPVKRPKKRPAKQRPKKRGKDGKTRTKIVKKRGEKRSPIAKFRVVFQLSFLHGLTGVTHCQMKKSLAARDRQWVGSEFGRRNDICKQQ